MNTKEKYFFVRVKEKKRVKTQIKRKREQQIMTLIILDIEREKNSFLSVVIVANQLSLTDKIIAGSKKSSCS